MGRRSEKQFRRGTNSVFIHISNLERTEEIFSHRSGACVLSEVEISVYMYMYTHVGRPWIAAAMAAASTPPRRGGSLTPRL